MLDLTADPIALTAALVDIPSESRHEQLIADEIEAALDAGDADHVTEEIGDLLFVVVNLARHANADPEMALRAANAKFQRRFGYIERTLTARGSSLDAATLGEMDALWNEAKTRE